MARYIDAEKLKCSVDSETDSIFDRDMTIEELYYNLCELIDDEPAADVQEIKRGYWHPRNHRGHTMYYVCARCGAPIDCSSVKFAKYCYKCGTRMGGDNNA